MGCALECDFELELSLRVNFEKERSMPVFLCVFEVELLLKVILEMERSMLVRGRAFLVNFEKERSMRVL